MSRLEKGLWYSALVIVLASLFLGCSQAWPFRPIANSEVQVASGGIESDLILAERHAETPETKPLIQEARRAARVVGRYVKAGAKSKARIWKPSEATKQAAGLIPSDITQAIAVETNAEALSHLKAARAKATAVEAWVGSPTTPLVPLDPVNGEAFERVKLQPIVPTTAETADAVAEEGLAWGDLLAGIAGVFGVGGAGLGVAYLRGRKKVRLAQTILKNGVKPMTDEEAAELEDRLVAQDEAESSKKKGGKKNAKSKKA